MQLNITVTGKYICLIDVPLQLARRKSQKEKKAEFSNAMQLFY